MRSLDVTQATSEPGIQVSYIRLAWQDVRRLTTTHSDLLIIATVTGVALTASQYHLPSLIHRAVASIAGAGMPGALLSGWQQVAIKLGRGAVILVLPLLSVLLMRRRLAEFGFGIGNAKTWLRDIAILFVLMLPLVAFAATRPSFQRVYPYFGIARLGLGYFCLGLLVRLGYMFCWEFLFRGYLLFGFEKRVGAPAAIAISTIPFVIMHFGKPALEVYGSIIAGVVLGIVAIRARSFIPCAIVHFAVAASMDVAALIARSAP
jgi:membrane protease YdiL (CAAX protease family)